MASTFVTLEGLARAVDRLLGMFDTSKRFLAAHPPGSIHTTTSGLNPSDLYGGRWRHMPSTGEHRWLRLEDDTATQDGDGDAFLDAWPVGSIMRTTGLDPASVGGRWERRPDIDAHAWQRVG
ncbi:hypothetical protein [Bifidobacterium stellenboschense]|uniref:Uncharacterized protein n=1 Tax=Bifidobacterium stellenboschense TaxID=762211 RepID=A0A087DQJ8_9BIFI|nr:hypothetical protein [Bifidobacterium stellenboschense]KFI97798.1 hypothetical protein BSTEL_0609 [Bifidobacterium stellenboschense]